MTIVWSCWRAAKLRRRAAVASAVGRDGGDDDDVGDGETGSDGAVQLTVLDIASRSR